MQTGNGRFPLFVAAIVILGLAGVIAYLLLTPSVAPEGEPVDEPAARPAASGLPAPSLSEKAPEKILRRPPTKMRKLPNAEARAALSRAIAEARSRRERYEAEERERIAGSSAGSSSSETDERPPGKLSKEYIRETVKEAIPMIKECYELALEENPKLAGRLDVNFTISGEPDVGGLVEESDVVAEEGLAYNETLEDCVRETVYTLEFPPPEGGGVVKVRYPLRFRPSEEEEEPE